MTQWSAQVRSQTRLIIDQIASMRLRLRNAGIEDETALGAYYKMLDELFEHDLRLAQLRDASDLLLRAEGQAFEQDPALNLVSSIFHNVTVQVTDLTKAIMGARKDRKLAHQLVNLGLSGIAKGSLYFGLKAQVPIKSLPLVGDADSLFDSTRRALEIIDDVAHTVEHDDESVSVEEVSEIVEDPKVRDAALVAVQRIAPSGRQGVDSLSVAGQHASPAALTPSHRRAIRASLSKPVIRGDEIELSGAIREIDLDARRFDLRGIQGEAVQDIRCAYRKFEGPTPRELLGSYVRVRGLVERSGDDRPRLMSVTSLSVLRAAPEEPD